MGSNALADPRTLTRWPIHCCRWSGTLSGEPRPAAPGRLYILDLLRFLAAMSVVGFHVPSFAQIRANRPRVHV